MQCRNDDEAALWRPVDGIAVLFVNGADMLEVADYAALGFLGAEEGDSRLRGNGGRSGDFACGDQDEAVSFRFPGEVDDGVFD